MLLRNTTLLMALMLSALVLWVGCDRHDPDAYSPSAPGVFNALQLSADKPSITADNSSTTVITATLTSSAAPGRRMVEFKTSTGTFVGAPTSTPTQIMVEAAVVRDGAVSEAKVTLKSSNKVETAQIEAQIKEGTTVLATAHTAVQFVAGDLQTIQLAASRTSLPADGFSRTELVATISSDTPSDRRTVVFTATKGTLVNGTGTPSTLEVMAGRDNKASAELISSRTLETSVVSASLKDVPGAVDRLTVQFGPPNPSDLIRTLSASQATAPADGATVVQVSATIAPGIPDTERTVTFTTTAGSFVGAATPTQTTARADASNRATVDLKADSRIVTAVLRATVSGATAETTLPFVRALPKFIIVDLGTITSIHANGTEAVPITAELLRDVGTVTDGTVVEFLVIDPATGKEVPLPIFRNVKPSAGGKATALLIAPPDSPRKVVTIRARVQREDATYVTGDQNITVID